MIENGSTASSCCHVTSHLSTPWYWMHLCSSQCTALHWVLEMFCLALCCTTILILGVRELVYIFSHLYMEETWKDGFAVWVCRPKGTTVAELGPEIQLSSHLRTFPFCQADYSDLLHRVTPESESNNPPKLQLLPLFNFTIILVNSQGYFWRRLRKRVILSGFSRSLPLCFHDSWYS